MNNQDKAVNIASIIKNLCDDKGTLIPLGKYMGTLTKDSPEWGPRLKQYNADKALLLDSLKADADDSTLRVRVTSSLVSPEKHRAIQANGFKSGSAMFHAAEITRKQKSKAFWDGMNANALPGEMGLTDKEFWQLARHNGFVSPEWKRTTSNGSLAFTAAAEAAWIKDYKSGIVAAREKREAVNATDTVIEAVNAKLEADQSKANKKKVA